jgi:ankyrin repeat protein
MTQQKDRNHHNNKTTEEVANTNTNTNTTNRRMNVTTERCAFLERVCTLDPSLFLVTHIAALKPELLLQKNFKKQSHLHIAAAYGASSEVMQFLLDEAPVFATHVDYRGRTPLHLACQCGLELMLQRHGSTDGVAHFMRVIQALHQINPQAVHCLDDDFRTPLQYAMTATATQQQQQHHFQTNDMNVNTDKSNHNNHSSSIVEELKRQQAEERNM